MKTQKAISTPRVILDSLNDGVYAVDTDRRITGWEEKNILGTRCADDVLCHEDKDRHRLCGEEKGDTEILGSDSIR